ncbi:four helix bundle protein [Gemmatimonas sp.]|uniref:four helix bundle protein n=1 Tax=Gemmatimonas sp. TaxID=1962908 RepID=UPI003F725EFC
MYDLRTLRVRQAARTLTEVVHALADQMDCRRVPSLRAQMLAAADSIPANIAEGARQTSTAQSLHFLRIARGSADELGVHLETAIDARAIPRSRYIACQGTRTVVCTMLHRLIRAIEERDAQEKHYA